MADDSDTEHDSFPDFKPSFVLIAIDTHDSMFIKNEDGNTAFSLAMNACQLLADSLVLEKNKRSWCQFAVVLAQEDSKASLIDFQSNLLDTIKLLKVKKDMSPEDQKHQYLRKGVFDLASFFLICKKQFTSISSKYYRRSMIYITNDDNPTAGDSQKRFTAINEAKSFESNDITFQIITTRGGFKYEIFYNELFSLIKAPALDEVAEDEEGLADKLSTIITTRYTRRCLRFYPLKSDPSRYLPVVKKDLIKSQKLNCSAIMSRDGKLVKRSVRGGGNPSNCFKLKGFDEVEFDLTEKTEIKRTNIPIGLTLIHVSKRLIDIAMVLTESSLIEFDTNAKENVTECENIFDQFWTYCYNKSRVLVCARKLKYLDSIRFVELIPKFAFGRKLFLMKTIPFQDEINMPLVEVYSGKYTDSQMKVVDVLIEQLTFDYDPRMFPSPSFAMEKAYIKSKLLNEPMEKVDDPSADTTGIDKTIEDVAKRFNEVFGLDDTGTNKRKAPARGTSTKKRK